MTEIGKLIFSLMHQRGINTCEEFSQRAFQNSIFFTPEQVRAIAHGEESLTALSAAALTRTLKLAEHETETLFRAAYVAGERRLAEGRAERLMAPSNTPSPMA